MRLFFSCTCFANARTNLKGSRQAKPLAITESSLLCGHSAIVVSSLICRCRMLQGSIEPFALLSLRQTKTELRLQQWCRFPVYGDKRSFVHLRWKAPKLANFEFCFINVALCPVLDKCIVHTDHTSALTPLPFERALGSDSRRRRWFVR